jgi:hypothetical protein
VIERLRTLHPEPVDREDLIGVVHPGTQHGGERVAVAEIDPDTPAGPTT